MFINKRREQVSLQFWLNFLNQKQATINTLGSYLYMLASEYTEWLFLNSGFLEEFYVLIDTKRSLSLDKLLTEL